MRAIKLRTKLAFSISLMVLVVVVAANLVYLAGVVQEHVQEVYSHASFLAQEIQLEIGEELESARNAGTVTQDPDSLRQFFGDLYQSQALRSLFSSGIGYPVDGAVRDVSLVTPDGVIIMDSNPQLTGTQQPHRPDLETVVESGAGEHVRAIFGRERIYQVRLQLEVGSQPLGSICIGVDTVLLRSAVQQRLQTLAIIGGLIVFATTLLALALAGAMLRPLGAISAQLDRLMAGRLTAGHAPASADGTNEAGTDATRASLEIKERPVAQGAQARLDEYGVVSSKIEQLGRQMEDARQVYSELQENVAHVLQRLEEGLLLFDADRICVMASAAAPRLLELAPHAIVGVPVETLFPGGSGLDLVVRETLKRQEPMLPRELQRHAGSKTLVARIDAVRDRDGTVGSLLTVRDAEPVRQIEDELELARRLSAVGRLTRGVAHEVKNPLNAMAIHLDLLREKAGNNAGGLHTHIDVIRREIDRLDRVVKTFLDFSRPVELQLVETDLSTLVEGVRDLLSASCEDKGVAIEVKAPSPGPTAWLDHDLIEQVLLNLVNNGVQAMSGMPRNGNSRSHGRLWLEVTQSTQEATVRVRDEGPGVPPEIREKIFDLYFTTRSEGTGIGLALASRIMQLHHGALELEPADGAGASFLLRFPVYAGKDRTP